MALLGGCVHGRKCGVWSVDTNARQPAATSHLACGITGRSVSRHGDNTRCLHHCGEFWEEEDPGYY